MSTWGQMGELSPFTSQDMVKSEFFSMEKHQLTLHQCSQGKHCTALLTLWRQPSLFPWELRKAAKLGYKDFDFIHSCPGHTLLRTSLAVQTWRELMQFLESPLTLILAQCLSVLSEHASLHTVITRRANCQGRMIASLRHWNRNN